MENIKTKFEDFKERLKDRHLVPVAIVVLILIGILIALSIYVYNKEKEYRLASENTYNSSFYELVNCADEVETYLAKASITSTAEHAAKTLSNIWNEANLAGVYLSQIPIKTERFIKGRKIL